MNPNPAESVAVNTTKPEMAKLGNNPEQSPYWTPKPDLSPEEIKEFSVSLDFLPLLLKNNRFQVDAGELTGAAIREMSRAQDDPHAFLVSAGKELAQLLRGNYITLRTVLGRLK